jgi:hypothetical protein
MSVARDNLGNVTARLTVNGPPTAARALACSKAGFEKGIWGTIFWAPTRATPDCSSGECFTGDSFYLARRDLPEAAFPDAEAGRVLDLNSALTSMEFRPEIQAHQTVQPASCLAAGSTDTSCTVTITANFSSPGIPRATVAPCANLDSFTGSSLYYTGTTIHDMVTRVQKGDSEQADVTAALNLRGCVFGGGGGGCREADGTGNIQGKNGGNASFQSDEDGCIDGDQNGEQVSDPGAKEDFRSTQVQSVQFDDTLGTMTVYGLGVSNGLPVSFLIVEQAATAATPALYSIELSDGYVNSGNLITGSITLH